MVIPTPRMNHNSGRFIQDHQVIILVPNVQRHFFGLHVGLFRIEVGVDKNLIGWFDLVIGFIGISVDHDHVEVHGLLEFVPGSPFDAVAEKFIDAYGFLSAIDGQLKSFVQGFIPIRTVLGFDLFWVG